MPANYMTQLTARQRDAVNSDAYTTLVTAPAGSGKTRVLTTYILRLLQSGVSPNDIIVFTFTRKAANEITERLESTLKRAGNSRATGIVRRMMVGTYHSNALRILRTDGDALGYDKRTITVTPPADADALLERACIDQQIKCGKQWKHGLTFTGIKSFIDSYYTTRRRDEDHPYAVRLNRIMNDYHARLREMNAMDFGLLLIESQRLLDIEEYRERYNNRYQYIVLDEAQDSDLCQYNLHHYFSPPGRFFAVYDLRQTIYGFRGARPDLIENQHDKNDPTCEYITLNECFRCGSSIVEAANNLISHNPEIVEPMVSRTDTKGLVTVDHCELDHFLMVQLHRCVQELGYSWNDIAILARTHKSLRNCRSIISRFNEDVPIQYIGYGTAVTNTELYLVLYACMRLMCNPSDDVAFIRLVNWLGMESDAFRAVQMRATETLCPMIEAADLGELGAYIKNIIDNMNNVEIVLEHLVRLLNVDTNDPDYVVVMNYFLQHCPNMSVHDAINWLATIDMQDDYNAADNESLTLATVHAAKGCEWPCVFLVDVVQDNRLSQLHEERRVMYVAVTRAKLMLRIHTPGRDVASQFIGELYHAKK